MSLGVSIGKLHPSVFIWHNEDTLEDVICAHVDDFLFGGSQLFTKNIVEALGQVFTIGTHYSKAFKYLGLNLNQDDKEICIDQTAYITTLKPLDISREEKGSKL